jgi:Ca2+-binding RTX toxin-like protein
VQRTNLTTFTLDVGTVETLDVRGGGGDDRLSGQPGLAGIVSLEFHGGAGNDVLLGGDGGDILRGDSHDDTLAGNLGGDAVRGGYGNDLILWSRGDGNDVVHGDEDFDTLQIHGSPTEDEDFDIFPSWGGVMVQHSGGEYLQVYSTERIALYGDAGNDRFYGTTGLAGVTTLDIDGGPGEDVFSGGDGDDTFRGGDDDDMFWGHAGDDVLIGGPGDDWFIWFEFDGFDGNDTVDGDDGSDFLQVSLDHVGPDAVSIVAVGDRVRIQRHNLTPFTLDIGSVEKFDVNGNQGDDMISGASGLGIELDLDGGDGNDFLVGGDGSDALWGGNGDDTLLGGDGDDTFLPGSGSNVLQGGAGDDDYHLGRDAHDAITDYEPGERIHVRNAFVTSAPNLHPGDDLFQLGYFQQWTKDGDVRLGFSSMEGEREVVRIYDVVGTFRSDPTDPFVVYLPEPGASAQLAAGLASLLALGRRERSRARRGHRHARARRP